MIEVQLEGNEQVTINGVTVRHRTPICHTARVLADAGNKGMAVATRQGRHAVYFDIEKTSRLSVLENVKDGPRFTKYRKFDDSVFASERIAS